MNIRLATATDIPEILDLERQCETAAHWSEGQYLSALPACGSALTSRLVLIVVDDEGKRDDSLPPQSRVAGFLVARHHGPEWELENIVVNPESRRVGVGTRLLAELFNRAQATGSECVVLEVRESNHSARKFYETWGFEETGYRKHYYSHPIDNAVLYRRVVSRRGPKPRT